MHSKSKGNIGEAAIILALSKLGFNVFKELGDLSKIDLVAEKKGKVLRIQCKGITPTNGVLQVPLRKCGPNYTVHYNSQDFDYFGICNLETLEVAFVHSSILDECNTSFTLRVKETTNNQQSKIHYFKDYLNIESPTDFGFVPAKDE